jgi:hypothetical protein
LVLPAIRDLSLDFALWSQWLLMWTKKGSMNSVCPIHLLPRSCVEGYIVIALNLINPASTSYTRIFAPDVRLLNASDYTSNKLVIGVHLCSFDRLYVFIIPNRCHLIIVLIDASFSIFLFEELWLSRVLLAVVVIRDSLLVTMPNLIWVLAVPLIIELDVIWWRV